MSTPATGLADGAAPVASERAATGLVPAVAAFASGALLSFAYPGWDQGWLAFFALAPVFYFLLDRRRTRGYLLIAAAFGCGFFGGVNHWLLAMHPLTWISPDITEAMSLGIVGLAWLLMALVLALGSMGVLTALGWTWRSLAERDRLTAPSVLLLASGAWVLLELVQAAGTFGYPWGTLALTQYKTLPLLQTLALAGPYPLSGLIVLVNAAIAWGLKRRAWKPAAGVAMVVVVCSGFGAWWMNRPVAGAPVTVSAVQGNISQTEKWTRGNEYRIAEAYFGLSRAATGSQLVIWPESAIPILLRTHPLYERFLETSRAEHRYYLTGTFDSDADAQGRPRYYNATTMFGPLGQDLGWDAKKHLVPFGEYLPWRDTLPRIWSDTFSKINLLPVDVTPGERSRPFRTEFGLVGTNVCFDSIFPDVMRATARAGAQIFVLVTNDAWYKHTVALDQHLAHGILRAVENRRPFIQAANTGDTAIVDHTGRIVARGKTWEPTVVTASVTPVSEETPYTRGGDLLAWLWAACALLGFGRAQWEKRRA